MNLQSIGFSLLAFFFFVIFPIVFGTLLLPFTPYLVKKRLYKNIKPFPSFIPFWGTILPLVLVMSWVWSTFFNGRLFYEWDSQITEYSLLSY